MTWNIKEFVINHTRFSVGLKISLETSGYSSVLRMEQTDKLLKQSQSVRIGSEYALVVPISA